VSETTCAELDAPLCVIHLLDTAKRYFGDVEVLSSHNYDPEYHKVGIQYSAMSYQIRPN
jgi:hypothetical protein